MASGTSTATWLQRLDARNALDVARIGVAEVWYALSRISRNPETAELPEKEADHA